MNENNREPGTFRPDTRNLKSLFYNGNGTFTYTPAIEFNGSDSFAYVLSDDDGESSTAVVTITVNAVNDVPVATGNTVIANEDVPLIIGPSDFSYTDTEGDSLVSVTITGLNLNGGTLTHTGGTVPVTNGMTITAAQLADLTFTSALNDSTDCSFTYTVNDAGTGVASAVMIWPLPSATQLETCSTCCASAGSSAACRFAMSPPSIVILAFSTLRSIS